MEFTSQLNDSTLVNDNVYLKSQLPKGISGVDVNDKGKQKADRANSSEYMLFAADT